MGAMKRGWAMLAAAFQGFDRWVREPVDPRPLGWFRAWFGVLCLVNIGLLWIDMPMWLGNAGVMPPAVQRVSFEGTSLTVFTLTGYDDVAIGMIRCLGVVGGLGLMLGICPRVSAGCTWLATASYSWRNTGIVHGGDALIRIGSFFLIFARSGAAFTLPRWLANRRRQGKPEPVDEAPDERVPAWPQRILQLQVCLLYLATGTWKMTGRTWREGSAVGVVLQLGEFQRFPIPEFLMTPAMSQAMTWGTLLFEFGFPVLVWFPRLRIPMLLAGLAFHAGLEWVLNVLLFQWVITSYYLLFLDPRPRHQRPAGSPDHSPRTNDRARRRDVPPPAGS
ncbi:MAG: HTTM domain-containing protein [Planctomycetia bacterium]